MGEKTGPKEARQAKFLGKRGWLSTVLQSSLLWGGLLTVGFYKLIPYLPTQRELAERYFCSHPLEYATAALFFVGIAILALKLCRIPIEQSAVGRDILEGTEVAQPSDPVPTVAWVDEVLNSLPARLRRTHLVQRVYNVCEYVRGRGSSERLEEHLKYLAELASERLYESYALVRTITWAVPIIGFLGTVIGITIAIANVTPEQLNASLGEVTGGLAIAFDTTALALTLSMLLVFGSFLVEQSEQRILVQVEDYGIKRIACLFPPLPASDEPLVQVQTQAAAILLEKSETMIHWQTQLWQDALEAIRQRWTETLQRQTQTLDNALQQGLAETLADHAQQLSGLRSEFLTAFQAVSRQLTEGLSESRLAQQELQDSLKTQLFALWQQVQSDVVGLQHDQKTQIGHLVDSLSEKVAAWQAQLQQGTDAGTQQLEQLRSQQELLLQILGQEEQLTRLQARLTENLEAVRSTETFEETLHSLSAAVHLLTARVKPKAA